MLYFYDRTSDLSGISQYNNFLDNQLYLNELHKDVKDVTNYQLIEVRKAIQKNTTEVQSSINNSIRNICGSMEIGFEEITNELSRANEELENIGEGIYSINQGIGDLNWRLNEIDQGIRELHSLFDWKTDLMIEQQRITNSQLAIIAKGVYLTEDKKQNIDHNRQGNLFLQAAISDDVYSHLYKEAFIEFNIAFENDRNDFFCLNQLGFIYHTSKEYRDIENAEFYFNKSAEKALVFSNDSTERFRLRDSAASSLSLASACNYALNKLDQAIKQIRQAVSIQINNQKYKFQLAKYLAANGEEIEAASILKDIIEYDKLYSVEILKDQDLITKPAIQQMLNQETYKLVQVVETELAKIKATINPESEFHNLVSEIENKFNPKTYINAREAKEKLRI